MYFQITTACNMSCSHCCMGCSESQRGEYMHPKIFRKAVELAEETGGNIEIGGGEPTVHPKFWEFFGAAMASDVDFVWMATNGKKTEIAKALAAISGSDCGKFACELSQDIYHESIDPDVTRAFRGNVRRVEPKSVINIGKAKENRIGRISACCCEEPMIRPNGDITACGCIDAPVLSHVDNEDAAQFIEAVRELESHSYSSCFRSWRHSWADSVYAYLAGDLNIEELLDEIEEYEEAA